MEGTIINLFIFIFSNLDCNCDPNGSEALTCDAETGQCHCKCNVIGDKCDTCSSGYHNFPTTVEENCHGMISQDFFLYTLVVFCFENISDL